MLKHTILRMSHLKMLSSTLLTQNTDVLYQQTRSTCILKRRAEPRLTKKGQKIKKLSRAQFIYDLVENTETKPQPLVKLILLSNHEKYGYKGEMISVKGEQAYNRLLLPKLAVYATPENIEKYYKPETKETDQYKHSMDQLIKLLSRKNICVFMSNTVSWTLEKWHVKVNFRRAGFHVPEDTITLPKDTISGPDMSLNGKQFLVTLKLNNCREFKVRCTLYHLDDEVTSTPVNNIVNIIGEPMFEEDKDILDTLVNNFLQQGKKMQNEM